MTMVLPCRILTTHMKMKAFEKLPFAFPTQDIPSWKATQWCAAVLSALDPVIYDCYSNSCCCFVGPHSALDACPYCGQSRHDAAGHPCSQLPYLPLTPCLKAFLECPNMAKEMQYHVSKHSHTPGLMTDIFDGDLYQHLCRTPVSIHGWKLDHLFFSNLWDVALGLSSDGFAPHRCQKKTAWPLILFNYNLPPEV
ncbi:hypothetical protein PUNSTDRAFT_111539 [Punctularia strigosozonata HHB-11173 SS5]|uniref:uncharacterized protein n=1 Tax=Punctularia strigosozonata (strain HHB-11173) TaxID=741275 RepID=UPI0004417177|nr:uncharacterized protein PUNSTDRAFT_111539 [Punctularia strigosozonata HHB-11173 SS5]EIN11344.1 hypothetical protein PUNSTDRAFT_111539 [Punctularia strigosozonata HHB-11173 SS5]